jgi:hypothetical protein
VGVALSALHASNAPPGVVGQATSVDLALPGATFNSAVENSAVVSPVIRLAGPQRRRP